MTTCSQRWRGSWWRRKGLAKVLTVSGERSANCGLRRRRRHKNRRTRQLSKGKLMPLRCCRCRSSRLGVRTSWTLTVHRAVRHAEIQPSDNCRYSEARAAARGQRIQQPPLFVLANQFEEVLEDF